MDPKELARALWGTLLLRGVLAVLFGIAAVFWPALTLVTLVYLFSAYVLVTGVVNLVQGVMGMRSYSTWYLTLLIGLVELGIGVYLLRHTGVTFATLVLLIGFTLVIRGVLEVVGAFMDMGSWASTRTLLTLGGLASVLAGIIVLMQPETVGVAFVWVLGVYALLVGAMMVAVALDARKLVEGKR